MRANDDAAFSGSHYRPLTLRTAPRDPIPDRAQLDPNWTVACQNQAAPIWNLVTPSGLPYGLVSASFQGAVRQGAVIEAIQWGLEMVGTDGQLNGFTGVNPVNNLQVVRKVGKGETNFWTRAFIICAEDIALANPYMIYYAAAMVRNKTTYQTFDDAERAVIEMTIFLTRSLKSRVCDWACINRVRVPEPFAIDVYYLKLLENLGTGNHLMAIGYAEGFIAHSLHEIKPVLAKEVFEAAATGVMHRGVKVKYYTNVRQLIWVALLKAVQFINNMNGPAGKKYPVVTEIVESCYDLAHHKKFMWEIPGRLFDRMAILAVCLREQVEARGMNFNSMAVEFMPNGREFTAEEIEGLRISHRNGNLWMGISDVCKDKHTKEGKIKGRDLQHFIEVKAYLRHEDPAFVELSDSYLKLCFETRYVAEGQGFDRSGMTCAQYAEWIPLLRRRTQQLNFVEDAIDLKTITITFAEQVENNIGMEKIGKLAPDGFSPEELMAIAQSFSAVGIKVELYDLRDGVNAITVPDGMSGEKSMRETVEPAYLLVLRGAGERLASFSQSGPNDCSMPGGADYLLLEMMALNWDSKALMKGRVVNKKARHNLCFADFAQEPDYEKGKGRIIDFKSVPALSSVREKMGQCFGPKAQMLFAEGNYYFDKKSCYIGAHGDVERRIVIGLRLGGSMTLEYQWYQQTNPVGIEMVFTLHHGDIYIMDRKASGFDWRKKIIPTLRHSANMSTLRKKV